MKVFAFFCVFMGFLSSASAAEFVDLPSHDLEAVTTAPKKDAYRVGDEISVSVSGIKLPEGSTPPLKLDLPQANSHEGEPTLTDQGWEVLSPSSQVSQSGSAELAVSVVPIKAGKLTLPSLEIKDSAGKAIARTNPWTAEVQSAIQKNDPEPQKPVDLKPPAELGYPWWIVIAVGVIAVLLVAAAVYALYRWSRKTRTLPSAIPEPAKPEDEIALSALAQLDRSGALARGEFKKFHFKISEILKSYIGARYGFDAPESTTAEMVAVLERTMASELSADMSQLQSLIDLFQGLDRVKFTDYVPELQESSGALSVARDFVTNTRRKGSQNALG